MRQPYFKYYAVIVSAILILTGCISVPNSPNPRFYILKSIDKDQISQRFNVSPGLIIGVGPIKTPEYLNRPQMITEDKDGMLIFAELDRWAEPLNFALARLVNENLVILLPGVTVEMFSWNLAIPVKYQVLFDVIQLRSNLEEALTLEVQWSVIDLENNKMVVSKRSEFHQPINPHTYAGLVQALSDVCGALSIEISKSLSTLDR